MLVVLAVFVCGLELLRCFLDTQSPVPINPNRIEEMNRPLRLKVALAGLGRIGKRHAINLLNLAARVEFVAAFSISPAELQWGKEHLEPHGVLLYDDYEQMMYHHGLQAVFIATAAEVHKTEVLRAIEMDLHVMCEKPLAMDLSSVRFTCALLFKSHAVKELMILSQCYKILDSARSKPHLKVMCGFSRRFDASYRDAWNKVQQGLIGTPTIIRSQTCDKHDTSGFFLQYSAMSGGIFVDMAIHDVDLSLWFFGDDAQPKCVTAHGVAALHPELLQTNDRDNAIGIVEYHGGRIAYFYVSRMMAHGQEDATDFIGTEGKISVNAHPAKDFVQLYHAGGITREIQDNFWARFEPAFGTEINEFVDCCISDTKLPLRLETAVKASEIVGALQESLILGRPIYFGEDGNRIIAAKI